MVPKVKRKLRRKFCKHVWKNDSFYPTHGYFDIPHEDSYCDKCGLTGQEYLR